MQQADILEYSRSQTMKDLTLDPCFYVSIPGFSYDAALLMTGVKLDLITDQEQHLIWESAVRGLWPIYLKNIPMPIYPDLIECDQEGKLYIGWDESKDNFSLFYMSCRVPARRGLQRTARAATRLGPGILWSVHRWIRPTGKPPTCRVNQDSTGFYCVRRRTIGKLDNHLDKKI